jgi:hypothetical protein
MWDIHFFIIKLERVSGEGRVEMVKERINKSLELLLVSEPTGKQQNISTHLEIQQQIVETHGKQTKHLHTPGNTTTNS